MFGMLGPRPLNRACLISEKHTPPTVRNLIAVGQTRSIRTEIRQKIGPIASCLSGPLRVIESDTDRSATYDFLLVIRSNYGPISYRFRDNWQL